MKKINSKFILIGMSLLCINFNILFAGNIKIKNIKPIDQNQSNINFYLNKINEKTIQEIEKAKKEAAKLSKYLIPINYGGFIFYSPESKKMIKVIDKKFKECLKDKKYKTNTNFCYQTRFRNLQKLKSFDEKQTYFISNQIYNLKHQKDVVINSIIMDSPQYKKYRQIKYQCMKLAIPKKIKQCFKENMNKIQNLKKKISVIKEKIIKKIQKIQKKQEKIVPKQNNKY